MTIEVENIKYSDYPIDGKYGRFGGAFAPEVLRPALQELEQAYNTVRQDHEFLTKLQQYNHNYGGRPTPLYFAKNLTEYAGGAKIFLKREDLVHGGAHKFNNVMGQGLLTKILGKNRIIAETGAGQHGTATALVGAVLDIPTEIYMGEVDIKRQAPNVRRMELMGAEVIPVTSGSRTLKDAVNEALRDWVQSVENTHYLIGSVVGPHPFPMIVRDFQSIIGTEIRQEFQSRYGSLPDTVIACVGGGSNAAGTFYPMIDEDVELIGVEAGGRGEQYGDNSATLSTGSPGVLHGSMTYLLQDYQGQIHETHSVSAGLDYPGVGPEHAFWKDTGRVEYTSIMDKEAIEAFHLLSRKEGIIPALESAHAIAYAVQYAKQLDKDQSVVVTLSGRGDKDLGQEALQ